MSDEYVRRLITCINRIDGKYYDLARMSAAGENQIAVLYALSDGGEHSQKSICAEWLIPKTTINTITRKLLDEGYIRVSSHSGKEKMLSLTDSGKEYAKKLLGPINRAERYAMDKTLKNFSPQFIDALEAFSEYFIECEVKNGD